MMASLPDEIPTAEKTQRIASALLSRWGAVMLTPLSQFRSKRNATGAWCAAKDAERVAISCSSDHCCCCGATCGSPQEARQQRPGSVSLREFEARLRQEGAAQVGEE